MKTAAYPKLKDAILLSLLLIVLQFAYTFVFTILAGALGVADPDASYKYGVAIVQILTFLVPLILALQKIGLPYMEVFQLKRVSWRALGYSLVFMFGFLIISSEIDNVVGYFLPMPPFFKEMFDSFFSDDHMITAILLVILIPGFFEEFFFRGLLLHGFTKVYSTRRSIVYSALLFGLIHLNPWQFVGAFLIGLFSAWIFIKTESIVISIVIHMVNNGLFLLTTSFPDFVPVNGFNANFVSPTPFQPLWFDCIGIALASIGMCLLVAHFRKAPGETTTKNNSLVEPSMR